MTSHPDVLALPLPLALESMKKAGIDIELERTYPPKPFPGNGKWRVVRQTDREGKALLVVAEECQGIVP